MNAFLPWRHLFNQSWLVSICLAAVLVLAGCASTTKNQAGFNDSSAPLKSEANSSNSSASLYSDEVISIAKKYRLAIEDRYFLFSTKKAYELTGDDSKHLFEALQNDLDQLTQIDTEGMHTNGRLFWGSMILRYESSEPLSPAEVSRLTPLGFYRSSKDRVQYTARLLDVRGYIEPIWMVTDKFPDIKQSRLNHPFTLQFQKPAPPSPGKPAPSPPSYSTSTDPFSYFKLILGPLFLLLLAL